MQFDDLDVVPENLKPLFVGRGIKQFAHVLPCPDERLGVLADPFHRGLPLLQCGQLPPEFLLLLLKPDQFGLDARKPTRPETLQNLYEPTDIRLRFLLLAAEHILFLPELHGFGIEAGHRPLNDSFACLKHPADFPDTTDDGVFKRLGWDAGSLARVPAALVVLARAVVVVMDAIAAGSRVSGHVGTTGAANEPGQKVIPTLRLLQAHASLNRLGKLVLYPVELLLCNERRMVAVMLGVAPSNLPDVDRIPENPSDLLFRKQIATALLAGTCQVTGIPDARIAQPPCHGSGGTEFLETVENQPHDYGGVFVELQ